MTSTNTDVARKAPALIATSHLVYVGVILVFLIGAITIAIFTALFLAAGCAIGLARRVRVRSTTEGEYGAMGQATRATPPNQSPWQAEPQPQPQR